MKKSKFKILLILLIILIQVIIFSAGTYAGYTLSAKDVTYTKANGTTISVKEALDELIKKIPDTVTASTATSHKARAITYSWNELASIAKMISNNSSITNYTAEVNVVLNGKENTIGVGDTKTVDGKTVRILGFNHNKLASSTAYGTATATRRAGISFEYVDFLTSAGMNDSDTNSGGWGECKLRSTLNGTTYSGLSIKDKIKQVNKEYIKTYYLNKMETSSDNLWLLSCAEVYGSKMYADEKEGIQYKYYELGNSSRKLSYWWLRSPYSELSTCFCYVNSYGNCGAYDANSSYGVAPGFSI